MTALINLVKELIKAVLEKINAVIQWILDLIKAIFKSLWDMVYDMVCYVFDQLLQIVKSALDGLSDIDVIVQAGQIFSQIPAPVLEVAEYSGIGPALAIIGTAIMIRFVLQLIPFVRLGS